jgi:chromosome partitioning protein
MKRYILPQEISKLFGISNAGVYQIIKRHNIPILNISPRKTVIPPSSARKILEIRKFNYFKKIFSLHDLKGGVGKTTLAFSFGIRASHYGFKVLLIDMDLQANLTQTCNVDSKDLPVWVNLVKKEIEIKQCIINVDEYLDLIPSSLNNSRLEVELSINKVNIKDHIKSILNPVIDNYDLVIIDCPPSLSKATTIATCASDLIIIPITPDQYSMDGMYMTIDEIKDIKESYNINTNFKILWNKYDARKKLVSILIRELATDERNFNKVLSTIIRVDSTFEISGAEKVNIFTLPKKASAQEDINTLTRELLNINF